MMTLNEPPLGRSLGGVRAALRQVAEREGPRGEGEQADAGEEQRPPSHEEEHAADRWAHRDAEVRRHAHRRVRLLVLLRRDEVGHHRLPGRAAEGAEPGGAHHQGEAEPDVVADPEEKINT